MKKNYYDISCTDEQLDSSWFSYLFGDIDNKGKSSGSTSSDSKSQWEAGPDYLQHLFNTKFYDFNKLTCLGKRFSYLSIYSGKHLLLSVKNWASTEVSTMTKI